VALLDLTCSPGDACHALLLVTLAVGSTAVAQGASQSEMAMNEPTTMVGGQAMFRTRDIVDNAVHSADHTTLVAAVKARGWWSR
jgi:uncharacterized surface protein with fasciclin (FAS1) repeats